jgi:carbamoyltransferase
MKVLGISGKERHAAAAVSIDGAVIAAAAEESFARVRHIGYRHTGGYPLSAIDACLTRASLTHAEIDRVIVVDDERSREDDPHDDSSTEASGLFAGASDETLERELRTRPHESVVPALADARQLTAVCKDEDLLVIVLGPEGGESAIFERRGARLIPLPGAHRLSCAIRRMADALGFGVSPRYDAIEHLGALWDGAPSLVFERAITWQSDRGLVLNDELFDRAIAPLRANAATLAADAALNVRVQQDRQALAASFCACVSAAVIDMAAQMAARAGVARVGLTGSLLSSRGLVTGLAKALGDAAVVAAVPEAAGRAIGAALDGGVAPALLRSLALGPDFSEQDIKLALDNCRLDYLYEPDWSRLLARISRMLSHGSVVAWFQGPMGFGPRSAGTRGILCDPANRYARENINRFLRHASIDDPLPVSMTATAMRDCLEAPGASPFVMLEAPVKGEWRDRLRASLDQRQAIPVQMVTEDQSPALFRLLEMHRERSGVPGLINTPLCGMNEPAACTPRDAVRTVFSSAIDALVIGRFLLMKDYWLLRSTVDS